MRPLTRAEALAQARSDFASYIDWVVGTRHVPRDWAYGLGRYWDRRLSSLARLGSDLPVAPEVTAALMLLSRSIRERDLDPDAALRWVDAFPDGVADLFPPSAVTFKLLDDQIEAEAEQAPRPRTSIASAA
jgi:hypothetical protein